MTDRKFDVVRFVGGPLDGVTWPCVLNPAVVAVRCEDGRLHLYECDCAEEYEDGTAEYRMSPPLVRQDAWDELVNWPSDRSSNA